MIKVNEILEINGVILTPEAMETIQRMQEGNNSIINTFTEKIADINDLLNREMQTGTEPGKEEQELRGIMTELSYLRKYLKDLRKP